MPIDQTPRREESSQWIALQGNLVLHLHLHLHDVKHIMNYKQSGLREWGGGLLLVYIYCLLELAGVWYTVIRNCV